MSAGVGALEYALGQMSVDVDYLFTPDGRKHAGVRLRATNADGETLASEHVRRREDAADVHPADVEAAIGRLVRAIARRCKSAASGRRRG